ncbi:hypothetical protein AK88_04287 [Plasmodium fragile]|uniref:Schizont-infected cell agglutination C-terminal domain-containing protein n=1 Tax=Plasmodium fragile TaxID=5857 RepID=A0A0D9QK64_PLAFR|nr:uncharacterized protein AK88_04287 [Plasmodium fragile]KJP86096.1 hypothetical protein AK88_04287 [Plasmodium fragile]
METQKLHAWKEWVAKQHRQMRMYNAQASFQHLLNNVEEETVPGKRAVPGVDNDLEVDTVMRREHMPRVRDLPAQQLHPQLYLNKPLCAKIWTLILALVIEQCKVERSLQDRELYVDALLQQL